MAFQKDSMFQRVYLPVVGNEDCSFVGITTLDGKENWVSRLEDIKRPSDGSSVFKFTKHGPCQTCVDQGIGADCPHYERAPWKSKAKNDDLQAIYKSQGEMALFEQEMAGMGVSHNTFTVRGMFITALQQRPAHVFTRQVQSIHLGIDPHGGGKPSDTAIVAMCQDQGHKVVRFYFTVACTAHTWPPQTRECWRTFSFVVNPPWWRLLPTHTA